MVDSIIPTEDVLDVEENDTKTSTDAFPSLTSTRDMQPQNTDYTNTLKNCKNAKQMPDKMPSKQSNTYFVIITLNKIYYSNINYFVNN